MKRSSLWWLSTTVSMLLIIILISLWFKMDQYDVVPTQLENRQVVDNYLENNWKNRDDAAEENTDSTIKIVTGIFIQSLDFFNSTEVRLGGYIWQRYQNGLHDDIKPRPGESGFILPEQVNSGDDIVPQEIYRVRNGDEEIIGWYFEAMLRQPFDYSHYPFDHKTAWVRMWHKHFSRNIVLVPDFQAYQATGISDVFGIEDSIVLGTWDLERTFFDYKLSSYDTNFGIPGYIGQHGFPELHYNIVVKRKFENAFILYLLPLFLVAALLFAALMTVSANEELSSRFGFDTSGFISGCSALFFVVMLAHIQLRNQFADFSIVYIEYFYILMYIMLAVATANTYLFSIKPKDGHPLITYGDNIIVKVAYWPVVLGCMILITLWFL